MKKEDKYDFELASALVPERKEINALFEDSLEKIMSETVREKEKMQKSNRIIGIIVTAYISLTLILITILLSVSSHGILKIPVYELQLNDLTLLPEQLLFYKIFAVVASLSLISFSMYFIQSKDQRSLA